MAKIDEIKMLRLGQRDENLARALTFDCSDWLEQYPEASIHILFRRPGESAIVPMSTTLEGTTLTWLIHDFEVGKTGVGNAEFRAVDTAGLRRKSRIIPCSIEETLLGDDETVLYTQDQVDDTLAHISEAAQAALAAKASEEAAALSAQEAGESAVSAGTAADVAVSARDAAQAAQTAAETAQHQAEAAQSGVHADAEAAEQAKVAAQAAQASAQGAASQASADRTAAESARADAEAAATHAEAVVEGIDQAGADQVAAVNAAGQAQVTAVNQAGTTQVGNVNTAGTTQVNAVQAKGTQVINSIPADYSALTDDVTDLKSAIKSDDNAYGTYATGAVNYYSALIEKTTNFYIADDGTVTQYNSMWYSDLVPVDAGVYRFVVNADTGSQNVVRVHGYDSNGEWAEMLAKFTSIGSGVAVVDTEIVVPDGVKFVRFSAYSTKHVAFFGNVLEPLSVSVAKTNQKVDAYSVLYDALAFIKNIFNKNDSANIHEGYFRSSSTGQLVSNSAFTELLVPCEPYTKYICRGTKYTTSFYDSSMNKIGTGSDGASGTEYYAFTTPAKCAYVSLNIKPAVYSIADYMVVTGEAYPDTYIPYNSQIIYLLNAVKTPNGTSISGAIDASNLPTVYHVGPNREYTSFTACIRALANDETNKIIYIDAGEYDIYAEIGGDAFAETVTGTDWRDYSVVVPTNTKIIGLGEVVFNFEIPDTITSNAPSILSPINVKRSVHIENITINATNCRYAIHDDGSSDQTCNYSTHVYKNVKLNKLGGYAQAFGAGIGEGTTFQFDDCVFKSWKVGMSFHNYSNSDEGGIITANNCVFIGSEDLYGARLSSLSGKTEDVRVKATFANCRFSPKFMLGPESGTTGLTITNPYLVDFIGCGSNLVVDVSRYETMQNNPTIYE